MGDEEYGVEYTVCYQVSKRKFVIYPIKAELNVDDFLLDMFPMEL